MNFAKHYDKVGTHAALSASTWRWVNDDRDGLLKRLASQQYATTIGTILHDYACQHIKYSIKMQKSDKRNALLALLTNGVPNMVIGQLNFDAMFDNLMAYTNDCIGFKMTPEVVLVYSENLWGTADAISFDEKNRFLRIHDYKSGVAPAHIEQLMIYAAYFCSEYGVNPRDIDSELRIYQSNTILYHNPTADELIAFMDQIAMSDQLIREIKSGG